ncbi:hypothetical protein EVAR_55895_1 [Eumeta japonica]|uniref:Uncharacterized protein n=1 Tax=Eumeta variegata TaxID=151549 RepID=A0A4C1YH31_EUMVA|nr:hypothetical protein EVAR_55895_1 [Eumeta japonica]
MKRGFPSKLGTGLGFKMKSNETDSRTGIEIKNSTVMASVTDAAMFGTTVQGLKEFILYPRGKRGLKPTTSARLRSANDRDDGLRIQMKLELSARKHGTYHACVLTVPATIDAKVDIGVPQPRSDNSTLDEVGNVPYEVGGDDPA